MQPYFLHDTEYIDEVARVAVHCTNTFFKAAESSNCLVKRFRGPSEFACQRITEGFDINICRYLEK